MRKIAALLQSCACAVDPSHIRERSAFSFPIGTRFDASFNFPRRPIRGRLQASPIETLMEWSGRTAREITAGRHRVTAVEPAGRARLAASFNADPRNDHGFTYRPTLEESPPPRHSE